MATEKILNTRVQLKYDTLANWERNLFTLKKGEIAIVEVPTVEGTTLQPVMFKVGDGTKSFTQLDWASAKAADVYGWAKKPQSEFETYVKGLINTDVLKDHYTKSEIDALLKAITDAATALTGRVTALEGKYDIDKNLSVIVSELEGKIAAVDTGVMSVSGKDAIIATGDDAVEVALKLDNSGNVSLSQSVNGLKASVEIPVDTLVTGSAQGTVAFNDVDVAVNGLGSAAYAETSAFDAVGSAQAVQTNLTNYEQAHENDYSNDAIDGLIAEAKKHADDNDANTEYHIEYDSTNKKIKLVAGVDASKMEIPTDDFIKDGMIQSVAISEDGKNLVITWNTDAGKEATNIPLTELVDVMTGVDGTTIAVNVSADDKISAEVKAGTLTTSHLAPNAGIVKTQLAADVQTSLGKADSALQEHQSLEHLATNDALAKVIDGTTPVAKATDADNATKLNGQSASYYATAASVTDITKDNGTIDTKISAYDTSKNFGDIITHDASEFASSAENGAKAIADTAVQSVTAPAAGSDPNGLVVNRTGNDVTIGFDPNVVFVFNCGDASEHIN